MAQDAGARERSELPLAAPAPARVLVQHQARDDADHQDEQRNEERRGVGECMRAGERLGDESPDRVGELADRLVSEMPVPEVVRPTGAL